MKSQELAEALAPFSGLVDARAIAPQYRCLELAPDHIRGCASFGDMVRKIELPIDRPCWVSGVPLIAVVKSLAADDEIELQVDGGAVNWQCGAASGRLASLAIDDAQASRTARRAKSGWQPGPDFANALKLGALSCDDKALAAVGMYGVVLDFRGPVAVLSSDNATISSCLFDTSGIGKVPQVVCFPPRAIELLAAVIKPGLGVLDLDESGASYRDADTLLMISSCATPKLHDNRDVLAKYSSNKQSLPLPRAGVRAFIDRVSAMATIKRFAYVELGIKQGRLALRFSESAAESEEYYLLEDERALPDLPAISVNAMKIARALAYTDEMVVDHLARQVVVFRGTAQPLVYCVAGRPQT